MRKNSKLFLLILFFICVFVIIIFKKDNSAVLIDSKTVIRFRHCSISKTQEVKEYFLNYESCVTNFIPKLNFDTFDMKRYDETKNILRLQKTFNQFLCNWVTIGIKGNAKAEKQFKAKYPKCSLFGIEPKSQLTGGFEKFGVVFPYSIDISDGYLTNKENTNEIQKKDYAFTDFLDAYLGTRTILYMNVNIEDLRDYTFVEELFKGKTLYHLNVTVCQLDLAIWNYNDTKEMKRLFKNFDSANSPYIPIHIKRFQVHRKVTFVNFKSEFCQEAFNLLPIVL